MRTNYNRRHMLQAAGLGAGSLFLPSLIGDRAAHAQGAAKRIVFFMTAHGAPTSKWKMTRPGLPTDPKLDWEFSFDNPDSNSFSEVLRPLHAVRKDVTVLDGLSYASCWGDDLVYNHHGLTNSHTLAGAMMSNGTRYSVDQMIADQIGGTTRFRYLYYGNNGCGGCTSGAKVFDKSGAAVGPGRLVGLSFLQSAYDRIFAQVSGTMPMPMPGPPSPRDFSLSRRKQSLDFLRGQYAKIAVRLGSEDRIKLERHRDMLMDLERQIQVAATPLRCEKPAKPTADGTKKASDIFLSGAIPVAMACDLTRVALFDHVQMDPGDYGAPSTLDTHADVAHASSGGQAADYMANHYRLHAEQFANMVQAFKSVPEGNGTMLDNSLLVWWPEHANGWHDLHELMIVVAGGGGGAFRPGRYVRYGQNVPIISQRDIGAFIGPPHHKLLVSLAKAMGVDRNAIGATQADINHPQNQGGKRWLAKPIDLTGPLPRLS